MSTVEPTDRPVPTAVLDGAVEEYPRDKLYVQVALILAAITAVEIATYAQPKFFLWHWGGVSNVGIISFLMLLMAVKFGMVAWFFMHLKWDKPILWRVFLTGILLAFSVYVAAMMMFRLFTPESMVRPSSF
jgi:cytochrome c oxidase subunit 4